MPSIASGSRWLSLWDYYFTAVIIHSYKRIPLLHTLAEICAKTPTTHPPRPQLPIPIVLLLMSPHPHAQHTSTLSGSPLPMNSHHPWVPTSLGSLHTAPSSAIATQPTSQLPLPTATCLINTLRPFATEEKCASEAEKHLRSHKLGPGF